MPSRWQLAVALATVLFPGAVTAKTVINADVDENPKGGVEVEATVAYDPNATTTPDGWLVPEQLESPSPFPAPSPDVSIVIEPPLPAPAMDSPTPGPNGNWVIDTCSYQNACHGQSCDQLSDTSCSVLETNFACDCTGCRCALDRELENELNNQPAPAPMSDVEKELSNDCSADCVSEGASCDYWEFNTCAFLEATKGCDCSGCACTGGTCESDHDDDSTEPQCEDWCGASMSKFESCSYCRCKACDFCVVGEDGQTAIDQQKNRDDLDAGSTASVATAVALVVATATALTVGRQ